MTSAAKQRGFSMFLESGMQLSEQLDLETNSETYERAFDFVRKIADNDKHELNECAWTLREVLEGLTSTNKPDIQTDIDGFLDWMRDLGPTHELYAASLAKRVETVEFLRLLKNPLRASFEMARA